MWGKTPLQPFFPVPSPAPSPVRHKLVEIHEKMPLSCFPECPPTSLLPPIPTSLLCPPPLLSFLPLGLPEHDFLWSTMSQSLPIPALPPVHGHVLSSFRFQYGTSGEISNWNPFPHIAIHNHSAVPVLMYSLYVT